MIPAWIEKLLEGMGIAGAIIFVLLSALIASILYIRSMQAKADKVYGYRLQERDTLNKALTDATNALADMLEATEDRNELTEEQARLLEKQAATFELLKVTILAQYDSIKDTGQASAVAVSSLADAVRTLTQMVVENRMIAQGHVNAVNVAISELSTSIRGAIQTASQQQIVAINSALGNVTVVQRKRRINPK